MIMNRFYDWMNVGSWLKIFEPPFVKQVGHI